MESGREIAAQYLGDAAQDKAILGFAAELFEGLAGLEFGRHKHGTFGAEQDENEDEEEDEDDKNDEDNGGRVLFPIGGRDEIPRGAKRRNVVGRWRRGGKSQIPNPKSQKTPKQQNPK